MINSMTGFGSSRLETALVILNVQVKSVNGRFLESRFRLPREYSAFETELKKTLSKKFSRGTFDVSVHREVLPGAVSAEIRANVPLAKSWMEAARVISSELRLDFSYINLETVLRFPEMVSLSNSIEAISNDERELLNSCFSKATGELLSERGREGEEQFRILNGLLDQISSFVSLVESKVSQINETLQSKLLERIKTLVPAGEVAIDPSRLAQEVLFIVERADISEEIERAKSHVLAFKQVMGEKAAVGKKLEFFTQEIHRELNTMGAKVQNVDLIMQVVEAKAVVERLREQVQNVE